MSSLIGLRLRDQPHTVPRYLLHFFKAAFRSTSGIRSLSSSASAPAQRVTWDSERSAHAASLHLGVDMGSYHWDTALSGPRSTGVCSSLLEVQRYSSTQ